MSNHLERLTLIESADAKTVYNTQSGLKEPTFEKEQAKKPLYSLTFSAGALSIGSPLYLVRQMNLANKALQKESTKNAGPSSTISLANIFFSEEAQQTISYHQSEELYQKQAKYYGLGKFVGYHSTSFYPKFMENSQNSTEIKHFNNNLYLLHNFHYLFQTDFNKLRDFQFHIQFCNVGFGQQIMKEIYDKSQKTLDLEQAYQNWKELRMIVKQKKKSWLKKSLFKNLRNRF